MTERERKALLAEAKAWWAIGRDIEGKPAAKFFGNSIKHRQSEEVIQSMNARAYEREGVMTIDYGITEGVARAYGAYWFALECEEEARGR